MTSGKPPSSPNPSPTTRKKIACEQGGLLLEKAYVYIIYMYIYYIYAYSEEPGHFSPSPRLGQGWDPAWVPGHSRHCGPSAPDHGFSKPFSKWFFFGQTQPPIKEPPDRHFAGLDQTCAWAPRHHSGHAIPGVLLLHGY